MNQYSSSDLPVSSSLSMDSISRRAYELWENEGRPEGCDLRHWLQAEQELGVLPSDNGVRTETAAFVPPTPAPDTGGDARPLQAMPAAAPANRENQRGSNNPFGGQKTSPTNAGAQSAARRRSPGAPAL